MSFSNWLGNRTGWPAKPTKTGGAIAARATWRRAMSSTIALLLGLQVLTGVALMTVYSPSASTAWASVWYIQTQVPAGWFVRGLHFFASDALVVLFAAYLLVSVFTRAFRAPREFIWWTALCLMGMVVALAHTGYVLPWDQDGYWGTNVRLNIVARMPEVGPLIQRLLTGGAEAGHGTLTRFYTLHVFVLPACTLGLVWFGWRCRKRATASGTGTVQPGGLRGNQPLRNGLLGALTLGVVIFFACYTHYRMGREWLGAPADPTGVDYPARPEWYVLFLFQWLKYFKGTAPEMIGAIVVPGAIAVAFFLMPIVGKKSNGRVGSFLTGGFTALLVALVVGLSILGVVDDSAPDADLVARARAKQEANTSLADDEQAALRASGFGLKRKAARESAVRAIVLANEYGVPPEGPLALLARDPLAVGPKLFAANCASCHRYQGHDGLGLVPAEPPTSSDLGDYATATWLKGFLADPMADRYFGLMKKDDGEPAHTKMNRWLAANRGDDEESATRFQADLDAVAAYLQDESLNPGRLAGLDDAELDGTVSEAVARGRRTFIAACNECHGYDGERSGTTKAPEMRGYGSVAWLELMIADPAHDTRYRAKGREPAQMPAFSDRLTADQIHLIAMWLHGSRALNTPQS